MACAESAGSRVNSVLAASIGFLLFGLFFAKGTPEPIVRKLNAALGETLDSPWVHDRFKDIVANIAPREERSPEYLKKLVDTEIAKMGAAIRAARIQQL